MADTKENICKFVMNPGTETDIKMMDKMLRIGLISNPNVKCAEFDEGTALMYQSSPQGTFAAMNYLIDNGADVNFTNKHNETALVFVLDCQQKYGLMRKTKLLLNKHANVYGLVDRRGTTIMDLCDVEDLKLILQDEAEQQEDIIYERGVALEKEMRLAKKRQLEDDKRQLEDDKRQLNALKSYLKMECEKPGGPDEKYWAPLKAQLIEREDALKAKRIFGGRRKTIRKKFIHRRLRKSKKSKKSRK